jgi:DNA modification methylase
MVSLARKSRAYTAGTLGNQLAFGLPEFEILHKPQPFDVPRPTQARDELEQKYSEIIQTNHWLDRTLVSFQANKDLPFYRWFKYREGFAAHMVKKVLGDLFSKPGKLLDPFAGAGSALFSARELGWATTGIELLPSAVFGIQARLISERMDNSEFARAVERFIGSNWRASKVTKSEFQHVRITQGAFPDGTEDFLSKYLKFVRTSRFSPDVQLMLRFAAYCVLEDISYTRKDGQYLRWDYRSGRQLGQKKFDKGKIVPFETALVQQLKTMVDDLFGENDGLFAEVAAEKIGPEPKLIEGSCLSELPKLKKATFDCVFTSPPYCNRYDYTRTYALELAFLGCDEDHIKSLRQQMLFCTVENKEKQNLQDQMGRTEFTAAHSVFTQQEALQEVLTIIDQLRDLGSLNNDGIAKLVRNYFYELNLVIRQAARVLKTGGYFVMVNDNVRYAGETVPVDTIMSEFADAAGLQPLHIWKLGRGKGNSSQQMGVHGRTELRKTICVWKKR